MGSFTGSAPRDTALLDVEKLYQYRGEPPACGWVGAIVRHEAGHAAAASQDRRARPLPVDVRDSGSADPGETLHRRQLVRVLLEAIDHLPPTYADVVRLRDLDERPVAEVARELHISRSNVAVRLHRAHKLLRRHLVRALGAHRDNGYARVSKTDGSQSLDLQRDALRAAGVDEVNLYHDLASGLRDDRPGLDSCLRALRNDDVLVVWKLDRLGRNLAHLVNTVKDLSARGVGLRVLAGQGAQIDTTTSAGRLVFGIFAALAEFERELIQERTRAGLKAARARGRKGGRKFALSKAQVRLAQAAMAHRDTSVSALCRELGISPVTLYRYVSPQGELREQGRKVLAS